MFLTQISYTVSTHLLLVPRCVHKEIRVHVPCKTTAYTALYSKSQTHGKDKTYFTLFRTYL